MYLWSCSLYLCSVPCETILSFQRSRLFGPTNEWFVWHYSSHHIACYYKTIWPKGQTDLWWWVIYWNQQPNLWRDLQKQNWKTALKSFEKVKPEMETSCSFIESGSLNIQLHYVSYFIAFLQNIFLRFSFTRNRVIVLFSASHIRSKWVRVSYHFSRHKKSFTHKAWVKNMFPIHLVAKIIKLNSIRLVMFTVLRYDLLQSRVIQ